MKVDDVYIYLYIKNHPTVFASLHIEKLFDVGKRYHTWTFCVSCLRNVIMVHLTSKNTFPWLPENNFLNIGFKWSKKILKRRIGRKMPFKKLGQSFLYQFHQNKHMISEWMRGANMTQIRRHRFVRALKSSYVASLIGNWPTTNYERFLICIQVTKVKTQIHGRTEGGLG